MKKFIILSYKRSGSTMLYRLLNSHPNIRCYGELFWMQKREGYNFYNFCMHSCFINKLLYYSPFRCYLINNFLNLTFKEEGGEDGIGFKLTYGQARDFPSILRWIKKHNVILIHLHRKNILKAYLSLKALQQRNIGHSTEKIIQEKIIIDSKKILKELTSVARRLRFMDWFCSLYFPQIYYVDIYYEDFLANMDDTCKRVLDFLGIDSNVRLTTDLKKLNPNKVKDIVKNFDALNESLLGTYFQQFID